MARDPFDGMSHEAMLDWLDQANSGSVQAAAEKLKAAAKEIHSIAEDLKVRPQWVKWKGEGAEAFRTWSGDLANATLALGDFSQDSAKWLTRASEAIGTAQASIPRDKASAKANLDAATAAHNDPDAAAVARKSSSELQAIAADKEKVRQEAAGEMRKLGQAYSLSSTQMDSLPRPKFPPPPKAFVPERSKRESYSSELGGPAGRKAPVIGTVVPDAVGRPDVTPVHRGSVTPEQPTPVIDERPTHMGIDSVGALPDVKPPVTPPGPSQPGPSVMGPNVAPPLVTGPVSPVSPAYGNSRGQGPLTGRGTGPTARGISPNAKGTVRPGSLPGEATGRPSTPGQRGPMMPGQNATSTGRTGTPSGRLPTNNGVMGGRPQPVTGQPAKGIPRGNVIGTEGVTKSRNATGQGPAGAKPTTIGANGNPQGTVAGRRVAGATGENGGIVGGRPQQPGRANSRAFSSGGSGLVRGQGPAAGAAPEESNRTGQAGQGGTTPQGARPDGGRSQGKGSRPDYLVEDGETWQPETRRNQSSVVDGSSENSER